MFTAGSILALFLLAHPRLHDRFEWRGSGVLDSLRGQRLNREDLALLERGYYEELLGVERTNVELWNLYEKRPDWWRSLWQTDAVRFTGDLLKMELVPDVRMRYKGELLTINRWGMRDRDYPLEKSADTYRIAVLGSSPVMGSGVADDEVFHALLEESLNREPPTERYSRYELLNFAVDSYTLLQQVELLSRKVEAFQPDAVLYVAHESEADKTVTELARVLERRIELPDPALREVLEKARVEPGTRRSIARRRLMPFAPAIIAAGYRRAVEACRQHGVRPLWAFMPMPVRATFFGPPIAADANDARVAELMTLADEAGFTLLDLSGVYDGEALADLWVATWDRHPNARAHRLVADRLDDLLRQALADAGDAGADPAGCCQAGVAAGSAVKTSARSHSDN